MKNDIQRRSIKEHLALLRPTDINTDHISTEKIVFDGEVYPIVGNVFSRAKIKARVKLWKVKQKVKTKTLDFIISKLIQVLEMKKDSFGERTSKGENVIGKFIFALIDISLLPNFHEIWKSVVKNHPELSTKEKLKLFFSKIDWERTTLAVIFAAAVVLGWVEPEFLNL